MEPRCQQRDLMNITLYHPEHRRHKPTRRYKENNPDRAKNPPVQKHLRILRHYITSFSNQVYFAAVNTENVSSRN
jgi:uncharacterized NAD-dependent epimerase/dehydratase family protein